MGAAPWMVGAKALKLKIKVTPPFALLTDEGETRLQVSTDNVWTTDDPEERGNTWLSALL